MTHLGLNFSRYINGVARRHGAISRQMFAHHAVDSITNGVHAPTWVAPPIAELLDRHVAGWREDQFALRAAHGIPHGEVWDAHRRCKAALLRRANERSGSGFGEDVLTIGFARRATAYKRADLLLTDLDHLRAIARGAGPIQVLYAGKAHPRDGAGRDQIVAVHRAIAELRGQVPMAYLEEYDMELAGLMTAGVDLWLNTPQPPMEASGTSGMKAALNGVPSLSVLDGWWVEGCLEGVTGWAIGRDTNGDPAAEDRAADAASLYHKLEHVVVPMFYKSRERWIDVMRHAIGLNGSYFNTQRMMQQYVAKAYF